MKSPLTFVSDAGDAAANRVYQPATAGCFRRYSSNISNRLLLILKLDGQLIKLHNAPRTEETYRVYLRVCRCSGVYMVSLPLPVSLSLSLSLYLSITFSISFCLSLTLAVYKVDRGGLLLAMRY